MLLGRLGNETIARTARQVNELAIGAGFVGFAGVTGHHVRIHIHGIHGVADGDLVLGAKDIEDAARIALGAVADEDFVVRHVQPVITIIVLGDGMPQPFVALLGTVTFKSLAGGHFIHGLVQSGDDGGGKRFGNIADAAADQALGGCGIRLAERLDAPADFRKQITGFEFQIIVVEKCHNGIKSKLKDKRLAQMGMAGKPAIVSQRLGWPKFGQGQRPGSYQPMATP